MFPLVHSLMKLKNAGISKNSDDIKNAFFGIMANYSKFSLSSSLKKKLAITFYICCRFSWL